jgi:hypothetical protein
VQPYKVILLLQQALRPYSTSLSKGIEILIIAYSVQKKSIKTHLLWFSL